MSEQEKIFVVVNPTLDEHVALDRAIITAQLMTPRPKIVVFVAIDHDSVDMSPSNDNIYRNTDWFDEQIHSRLKAADLDYQIEISWSDHWQKAIMRSAQKVGATRIIIRAGKPKSSSRFGFTENKWKSWFGSAGATKISALPPKKYARRFIEFITGSIK